MNTLKNVSEALNCTLKAFKAELKELKVSKSAIQFPNDKPLPLDLIKRIVVFRKKENEVVKKEKGTNGDFRSMVHD